MNREALATLLARAEETHSDALAVRHRERVVGEWHFGRAPDLIVRRRRPTKISRRQSPRS